MGYLIGDVLIASAFLSYTGPFLSNYRDDLVEKQWIAEVSPREPVECNVEELGEYSFFMISSIGPQAWSAMQRELQLL